MKWFGKIGFMNQKEIEPGVFEDCPIEKEFYGEVLQATQRNNDAQLINPELTISNRISILLDSFIQENISNILYITFSNAKWKINNIEFAYPRVILTLGGKYQE